MAEEPVKYQTWSGERPSGIQAGDGGAELRRLLRYRMVGTAAIWVLAIAWWRVSPVNVWVASAAASLSMVLTAFVARQANTPDAAWWGEAHVAADILIMPAFVTAAGGWRSPFAAVLLAKGVSGALIVGQRRAGRYFVLTLVTSFALWSVIELRALPVITAGGALEAVLPPFLVVMVLSLLSAVLLQAASFPLDTWRQRRRELLSENRRLEEAIAELETQNRRLVALQDLSRDIGVLGTVLDVAKKLQTAMRRTFPGRDSSFFLLRRDTMKLEPLLLAEGAVRERVAALVADGGAFARAARGKDIASPLIPAADELLDPRTLSQIVVPMTLGEKPVGLLVLESRVEERIDPDDLELLRTMANEMAVAVRNADLNARARELRESQESLIENANALILVIDGAGAIQVANRMLLSLVEPEKDIAVGMPAADLFTPESARLLEATLATAHEGRPVENVNLALRGPKSSERRAVFNLAPVFDRDGRFLSAIAVGQDVTRLELLERSVIQSEKLASLGQFVAGIAHEMNNPLTAITVYADYLRTAATKGPLGTDGQEKLDEIAFAGERIQGFVQSLLGFARPTANTPRALDLNGVVQAAVKLCHYDLKKAQVEVVTKYGNDLPAVAGVEGELQQVLINLFTNSAHAAPESGGRLVIATSPHENGVRVTVTDNGSGIPEDVLPHIFEPFYTTKAEGKGTGLGLSIVKRIIDSHHGAIDVQSAPGKGTTFTLDFPAAPRLRARGSEGREVSN
ncbi:MAG TPA: ATP-binding protein [bacterium]|nr:ATP-binding protein [bacterium]